MSLGISAEADLFTFAVDSVECLTGKLVVTREQAVAFHRALLNLLFVYGRCGLWIEEQCQEIVAFVAGVGLVLLIKDFSIHPLGHGIFNEFLLFINIMLFQKGGRVTNILIGLIVLLFENLQNALIALNCRIVAAVDQVGDDRLIGLPVAVYPAIALLEHHERPRQIKVNQPMGQVVQVDTLGGDVGTEQYAQLGLRLAEGFDNALLFYIAHTTVENLHGIVFQLEVTL